MEFLKKVLSLFLCFLMGITGPVISSAVADGYGNTAGADSLVKEAGGGGCPCVCPGCPSVEETTNGSSQDRGFYYNGSEFLREVDLSLPGVFPITIERTYNNQSTFDSPLGYGWDISYNERLRTYKDNSVTIRSATGIKRSFVYAGGAYVSEDNPRLNLIQNPDGSFVFYGNETGLRRYYDQEGKLVRQQTVLGNSLRMQYSEQPKPLIGMSPNSITPDAAQIVSYNHQLQRIEEWDTNDSFTGKYVEFIYDNNTGRLTGIIDSAGRSVSYQHDSKGNLTRINYAEGLYKACTYSDPNDVHNMTLSQVGYDTNAPRTLVTREYDTEDRMIAETRANGGSIAIDYTIPLQKTSVTKTIVDSDGITLHQFKTVYEFNTDGYLLKITDDQKALEYVRDSRNNIVETIGMKNNGTVSSPTLVTEILAGYTFDTENRMTASSIIGENGEKIINEYIYEDGVVKEQQMYSTKTPDRIHKTKYSYNYIDNNPTTIKSISVLTDSTTIPSYNTISLEYNDNGRLIDAIYENGDKISLEYDNGFLTKLDGISFSYDIVGQMTGREDRNGHLSQYRYDNLGRLVQVVNALGEETIYTYTGWQLTQVEQGKTVTTPGKILKIVYNEHGQLKQHYIDFNGSPVMQETYSLDSNGNILTVVDQQGRSNSFSYDPWNRLISTIDSKGDSSSALYSSFGQLLSLTDAMNNTTSFNYDTFGRLTQITDALGGTLSQTLDEASQVLAITDAEGREFNFGYDLAGRMIWKESPVGGRTVYGYDVRSRINTIQHSNGQTNKYQYNTFNQVEQADLAAGTVNSSVLRYGYDNMSNLLWYSDSTTGAEPLLTMTYDVLNRLKTRTVNPINKTMQFDYTARGERQKLTILDNSSELFSYSYVYDTAGRLTTFSEQPVNKITSFSYDTSGILTGKSYPNGMAATLGYSTSGMLADLHYQKSDGTTIDHFQYTHDKLNQITGITDNQNTTAYNYDNTGQLIDADYSTDSNLTDENYTYDLTGNRLTSSNISDWTYSDDGKLLSYGGHTINYDERGRQISEAVSSETTSYLYDSLSRLLTVTNSAVQEDYSYDYTNRRIKKSIAGSDTWYLYDGAKILAIFDDSGQLVRNYSYQTSGFDLLGITENQNYYSVLNDHSQTPRYVIDSNQSVLWKAEYQAFGESFINSDVDNDGTEFSLSHRFPGQYFDSETEQMYNWFRSYNPQTGRYTSPDPIGLNGGVNLFTYGMNNPVNLMDPDGLIAGALALGILATFGLSIYMNYDSKKNNMTESVAVGFLGLAFLGLGIAAGPLAVGGTIVVGGTLAALNTVGGNVINSKCPSEGVGTSFLTGPLSALLGGPTTKAVGEFVGTVGPDLLVGTIANNSDAISEYFFPPSEKAEKELKFLQAILDNFDENTKNMLDYGYSMELVMELREKHVTNVNIYEKYVNKLKESERRSEQMRRRAPHSDEAMMQSIRSNTPSE